MIRDNYSLLCDSTQVHLCGECIPLAVVARAGGREQGRGRAAGARGKTTAGPRRMVHER